MMIRSSSKSDLLATIESQKDQIQRYETRLRDVVKAYKSLAKEKEVLQSSLAALCPTDKDDSKSNDDKDGDDKSGEQQYSDPLQSDLSEREKELNDLREKVRTLTAAVTSLTQSKSKMETDFQADRRHQIQKHEGEMRDAKKVIRDNEDTTRTLEGELKKVKSLLRQEQYDQEKKVGSMAGKVKDVQDGLAKEREEKEGLVKEVKRLEREIKQLHSTVEESSSLEQEKKMKSMRFEESENRVRILQNEVKRSDEEVKRLRLELIERKNELEASRSEAERGLQGERLKQVRLEEIWKRNISEREERILILESKLAELSGVVGGYEKDVNDMRRREDEMRRRDEDVRRREEMTRGGGGRKPLLSAETDDAKLQLLDSYERGLSDPLTVIREILTQMAAPSSEHTSINFLPLLTEWGLITVNEIDSLHTGCREEVQVLRDEIKSMKIRSSGIMTRMGRESSDGGEEERVVEGLKKRVEYCEREWSEERKRREEMVASLRDEVNEVKMRWKDEVNEMRMKWTDEVESTRHEFEVKLADVTQQMVKQRERTVNILAEKEKEMESMRGEMGGVRGGGKGGEEKKGEASVLTNLDESRSLGHGSMLHYTEEMARQEGEMTSLRRSKFEIECALRELQVNDGEREEQMRAQLGVLKEEIRRLERGRSRETANLEYLKNVLISWATSGNVDSEGRTKMMNAVATILHFSPGEREKVLRAQAGGGWWGSGGGKQ